VVLPPKLNIDKFIRDNYEVNPDTDELIMFDEDEAFSKAELKSVLAKLKDGGAVYENDCDYMIYSGLAQKLKDFVIEEDEIGPDEGHFRGMKWSELMSKLNKIKVYKHES